MNYSNKFIIYLTSSALFSLGLIGLIDIGINDLIWYESIIIQLFSIFSISAGLFVFNNHIDEIIE